jgi:hypothetical protein
MAATVRYNRLLFQRLTGEIRYLPDQWRINRIFPPINELKRPYQSKNNRIRTGREKGESGRLSTHDIPPANADPEGAAQPSRHFREAAQQQCEA